MEYWQWAIGALGLGWLLLNYRTRRADGVLVSSVHPYRRMLLLISPTRTESTFQADLNIPAKGLEAFLKTHPQYTLTEIVVAALLDTLATVPEMNRFVAGGRLYERSELSVAFSVKRKKGEAKAKVAVVKIAAPTPLPLRNLSERLKKTITRERSGERTYADKEYDLFSMIPHGMLKKAPSLLKWLDSYGLLPRSFMANDPLFSSAFIANLGSIDMNAGHHHLFEWGNCPIFITVGKIEWAAVAGPQGVTTQLQLPLRITYDERIDDGMTARAGLQRLESLISHPESLQGNVEEDSTPEASS